MRRWGGQVPRRQLFSIPVAVRTAGAESDVAVAVAMVGGVFTAPPMTEVGARDARGGEQTGHSDVGGPSVPP
jgi:hypothetical protein